MDMDKETLLKILQIVIDTIGEDKFDIFDKTELYELTNGELFYCDEVLSMLEIQGKLKEMDGK